MWSKVKNKKEKREDERLNVKRERDIEERKIQ